jgi:hypothetical protein
MAYLTEKLTNMNLARDSSDSDIDIDQESVHSSTRNWDPADKHLKFEQPNGIHLISTDTRPIKATSKLALDTIRANEIRIENSKTGKMTAVVAILKIFGEYINNSRNANPKKS